MGCCPWPPTGSLIHPAVLHPGRGACGRGCLPTATCHAGGDTGWRRGVTHHLPPVQGEVWGTARGGGVCDSASLIFLCLYLLQNVNDLNQWLSALRKASAPNPGKLSACHPGAFRSGRWTCCLQAERSGEVVGVSQDPLSRTVSQWHPTSTWACDLISLCLSIFIWEAGLRIACTSLVLLADIELIYSKCHLPCSFSHMQVLFPTVLLFASCPERRQSDLLKLDGHVVTVTGCSAVAGDKSLALSAPPLTHIPAPARQL